MRDELDTTAAPSDNLLTAMRNRVEECFQTAEKHYEVKIPRCSINFTLKGTKAGTACFGKKELRFNRKLAVENRDHFMNDTVPHEVAHIVQRWRYGYQVEPHGREWKKIMVEVFRIPPKRCHNLDVSSVKRKTKEYAYVCGCNGGTKQWMVGAIKHKTMQRNTNLVCTRCLKPFVFAGKGGSAVPKGLTEMELD